MPASTVPAAAAPSPLSRRRLLSAAALLPWASAAWAAGPVDAPNDAPKGTAVPIGGALSNGNDAVWRGIVDMAGGAGSPWVVLGTASSMPEVSAANIIQQLQRRGARATALPVSPLLKDRPVDQAVRDPALVAQVRAARGVFFGGGAQERIVSSLMPGGVASPLLEAIWEVYRAGGVVAGTSAGAAIMSQTMFVDAPDLMAVMKGRLRPGQEYGPGLGFVDRSVLVDQHFLRRGRIARLLPLMLRTGHQLGLGVEEDAGVAVRGLQAEVLGGQALFIDLTEARSDAALGAFNLQGARISLLGAGDRLDLGTRTLQPVAHRARGQVYDPAAPDFKAEYTSQPYQVDMLANGVLPASMGQLIDGSFAEVRGLSFDPRGGDDPALGALGFEWRLYKPPGCRGWTSDEGGGEDYTIHRMGLDVRPVRMAQPLHRPWATAGAAQPG